MSKAIKRLLALSWHHRWIGLTLSAAILKMATDKLI